MENYVNYLYQQINTLNNDLGLGLDIKVANEQYYVKKKEYLPNTVYCVVKFLTATLDDGVTNQPIQLVIISEENKLDKTQVLFNTFAANKNLTEITLEKKIKQTFTPPVVMNNFVEVGNGKRSLMYMTGTLIIVDVDVSNIDFKVVIDNNTIETQIRPLTFSYAYQMSTNTQQLANDPIAKSEKQSAVISVGMQLPLISNNSYYSDFIQLLLKESGGKLHGTLDGNTPIEIKFEYLGVEFKYEMKLQSLNLTTGRRNEPALQVGFIR